MLICQHCCGHHHCHLFAVGGCLECCTYRHFCLSKAHIATHKSVHRTWLLHVSLHVLRRFQLVGCVLINETGFQFLLQITVLAVGKPLLFQSGGIEFDEVTGNVLHLALHPFLHAFPSTATNLVQTGSLTLLAFVFGDFMQGVDGHIHRVFMQVCNLDHLLHHIALWHSHQSSEPSHAVVYMHHIIANLKLLYLLQRQCHLASMCLVALQVVFVEAVKDLVVGEEA